MESAKLSKDELIDIIFYAIKENNIEPISINKHEITTIINDYQMFCSEFKNCYVKGELDTFKRAACLLVAINQRYLSHDKRINASIALDAAYKMCEKPYWNVGPNFDEPKKLEEVNFKEVFIDDMYVYNKSKEMLIDSLVFEQGSYMSYHLNLELFYQVALEIKHRPIDIPLKEPKEEENNQESIKYPEKPKLRNRILNIFKR